MTMNEDCNFFNEVFDETDLYDTMMDRDYLIEMFTSIDEQYDTTFVYFIENFTAPEANDEWRDFDTAIYNNSSYKDNYLNERYSGYSDSVLAVRDLEITYEDLNIYMEISLKL